MKGANRRGHQQPLEKASAVFVNAVLGSPNESVDGDTALYPGEQGKLDAEDHAMEIGGVVLELMFRFVGRTGWVANFTPERHSRGRAE